MQKLSLLNLFGLTGEKCIFEAWVQLRASASVQSKEKATGEGQTCEKQQDELGLSEACPY